MNQDVADILKFFAYDHLPKKLQDVSRAFHGVAHLMVATLPQSTELLVGLRKLLESKDCMVRAAL